ncbi:hypothetical protein [Nitrogeniibacter mangrovi]|uniref:hypothetical protein n=1 Tax=Nitrogeniibacter mangrovi TaxID=2016596 RepID=UPI00156FD1BA|nr:hypothetical protein [Nitrogeniibacter mangrovi]
MKLDHLPIGARFEWKGRTLTKVGPMTGATDKGGTVFIPKHAVLTPIAGEGPAPAPARVDAADVVAAFEAYHRLALSLVSPAQHEVLHAARAEFLRHLD